MSFAQTKYAKNKAHLFYKVALINKSKEKQLVFFYALLGIIKIERKLDKGGR
jgi:hypothetical protein